MNLRELMLEHDMAAWIIPTADPHLSEYLPEHWQARAWFSGFTGSAGVVVVTAQEACLWADSRYWEQAEYQLSGSDIVLEKLGFGRNHMDWLLERLPENARVGVAADMFSLADKRDFLAKTASKNWQLVLDKDLVDEFWLRRPPIPQEAIFVHEDKWVGATTTEKMAQVRHTMKELGAKYHLISALDDIAWLLNLRGEDVEFNPVFISHLLIDNEKAILFVDERKLEAEAKEKLAIACVQIAPYAQVVDELATLSGSLLLEPAKVAMSTLKRLPEKVKLIESMAPSSLLKAQKTAKEQEHIREAMRQDGAALCGFFAEFEEKLQAGEKLTELDVDDMLLVHRARQPNIVSASFETIAGFNGNGAMPHYRATFEKHSVIEGNGLLLIDSGAQYLNGTTDITRVIPIGETTQEQRDDFTYVLKAHIALARLVFPEGTLSPMLDAVCRQPLWQVQRDFGHGTGHGVGYFLNVHEGPQRIAYQATAQKVHAMREGMLTSNEPGLYRPNRWGIRIENLLLNQRVQNPAETEFGDFLCFETVTLCPIDTRLITIDLLTSDEKTWLNQYHQKVRQELANRVTDKAYDWLIKRTEMI